MASASGATDGYETDPGSDDSGSNPHDNLPLGQVQILVRSPGGVPRAAGNRNYGWHDTETLAAVHGYDSASHVTQRQSNNEFRSLCQARFEGALESLRVAHEEFVAHGAPSPFAPIFYSRAGVNIPATLRQVVAQRGAVGESTSVHRRADEVYKEVKKHIVPRAKSRYARLKSGETWADVVHDVREHVDTLCAGLSGGQQRLLRTCAFVWQWTCPQSDDVARSSTLASRVIAEFSIAPKRDGLPSLGDAYPKNRQEQREWGGDAQRATKRADVTSMREESSAKKRKRELHVAKMELLKLQQQEARERIRVLNDCSALASEVRARRKTPSSAALTTSGSPFGSSARALFREDPAQAASPRDGAVLGSGASMDESRERTEHATAPPSPKSSEPAHEATQNDLSVAGPGEDAEPDVRAGVASGGATFASVTNVPIRRSLRSPKPSIRVRGS